MHEKNDTPIYYDQRSVALRTTQSICFVQEHDKTAIHELLLKDYEKQKVVILVKSKKKADVLSKLLNAKEFNTTAIHGNHRQSQQQEAANKFNATSLHVLITTDMILKTLALENIKLLVSYDLPDDMQAYYNRLATMKEQGVGMALVSPEDEPLLEEIEYNMKKEIDEKKIEGFMASKAPNEKNKQKKEQEEGI